MSRLHHFLLMAVTSLLLLGCATQDELPLLQTDLSALGPEKIAQQRLQLNWHGETHVLENVLQASSDAWEVIGLAMGMRVYSFRYDGQSLHADAGHLPYGLSEQRILNDLLLIHAPQHALAHALPPGWALAEQINTRGQHERLLLHDKEVVITVQYDAGAPWSGRSVLTRHHDGYQLILDSASEP